ncbi:hypothetical protein N7520_003250 [Penicillium odoratum]|uniref:uncharacterized protein n=1 Tax=Penicillium odoratum TaxID=1167516 RepID=UPI002547AEAC|nr:uncharacterized protein N7520_003250 [Penicillium odoratum]KAJ5772721.1 hypothetical protein N7520_003250 [Penicillium odoratum]
MHQTQSLHYGIVLEGTIEMVMDDGQVTSMRRGEVAVQRATMHGWKNPSKTEWARMVIFHAALSAVHDRKLCRLKTEKDESKRGQQEKLV